MLQMLKIVLVQKIPAIFDKRLYPVYFVIVIKLMLTINRGYWDSDSARPKLILIVFVNKGIWRKAQSF